MSGLLIVKPISAKLKRDTETFGKMDPFCKVKIGSSEQETRVHQNGGKFPAWTDTLAFQRGNESLMTVQIWDKDTFNNDLIGETTLPLSSFIDKNKSSDWHILSYKGKNAGEILLEVEFKKDYKEVTPQFGSPSSNVMMGGTGTQPFSPQFGITYMLPQMYMSQQQQQPVYVQPQQQVYSQPIMGQTMYTQPMQQPTYIPQMSQPGYSQPTYVQPMGQPGYVQVGQQTQPMSQPTYYQQQPQTQTMPTQTYYQGQQGMSQPGQNYYAPPGY
jgi:hypothetical protein